MSQSNRLLDMFQADTQQDTTTQATTARVVRPDAVPMAPRHATDLGCAPRGEKTTSKGIIVAGTKMGASKLERENRRLREQLKFQGAVLDQLAGDVHALERQSGAVYTRPPPSDGGREGLCEHSEEQEVAPLASLSNVGSGASASDRSAVSPAPGAVALSANSPGGDEHHESTRLRRELTDAREAVEGLRRDVAAERRTAEESSQTQVDLLCRERKFRAAVEAGLREKVHSTRQRARDREGRLSAELSFARKQLTETVGLLASKEEGLCLARTGKAEQEEKAAAALARLKERDRQARWLEHRLAEVSSGEAAASMLCMEEMTASLVAQQQEIDSLRAVKHNQRQSQSVNSECSGASREECGHCYAAIPTPNQEDAEVEVALGDGIPKCVERSSGDHTAEASPPRAPVVKQSCLQAQGPGDEVEAVVIEPLRRVKSAASARGSQKSQEVLGEKSLALFNECAMTNGPHPESSSSLLDGCLLAETRDASSTGDVGVLMSSPGTPSTSEAARAERLRQMLEWLLTPRDGEASVPPPPLHEESWLCDRRSAEDVRAGILAALSKKASPAVMSKIVRRRVQKAVEKERAEHEAARREWQRLEGDWEAKLAAREEELARLHVEGGGCEREAVGLKVERQAMLRRLRKLDQEAEDKTRTVTELERAASTLGSELTECRDARKGLQRELSQHIQARRVLEKRAKLAEESVSKAAAQAATAERAKTLLKARLTAASRRGKNSPSAAEAGAEGCPPPSDNGATSNRGGSVTTDIGVRDEEEERGGKARPTAAGEGQGEAERQLDVMRTSLDEALVRVKLLEEQLQEARDLSRLQMQDAGQQHAQQDPEWETKQPEQGWLQEDRDLSRLQKQDAGHQRDPKRENKESEQALVQAEMRVAELERAWGVLAAKVVSLADRNAELEWVVLWLRRGQSHTDVSNNATLCGDALVRVPLSVVASRDEGSSTTSNNTMATENDGPVDVPRATLDLEGLLGQGIVNGKGLEGGRGDVGQGEADIDGDMVVSERRHNPAADTLECV